MRTRASFRRISHISKKADVIKISPACVIFVNGGKNIFRRCSPGIFIIIVKCGEGARLRYARYINSRIDEGEIFN